MEPFTHDFLRSLDNKYPQKEKLNKIEYYAEGSSDQEIQNIVDIKKKKRASIH